MNSKALYNLSYGIFVLGAKSNGKINACITNTCIQVASEPVRVAISILNQNLTCSMVKESGFFSLSVLDSTCSFDLIKHFGFQSGKTTDKFANFKHETDSNGCPYITESVCSVLKCKVLSSQDLGTHTLFIAEVQDAEILSSNAPVTYADYQNKIKPKQPLTKKRKSSAGNAKSADLSIPVQNFQRITHALFADTRQKILNLSTKNNFSV